jgi:Uma2 family endonuclease
MAPAIATPPAQTGPAWAIATLFPDQGQWGEGDYLALNRRTNRVVELADGVVEVLSVATLAHQRIVLHFRDRLREYAVPRAAGETLVAPYPVRVGESRFRQPDVVFVATAHADWVGEEFAESADLVMEVVSEDRARDLVTKRREYAEAGIAEYWIVDPKEQRVTVLALANGGYATHAEVRAAGVVTSALLNAFSVDVATLFASASRPA